MGSGGRWRILEGINQTVCTYAYIYIYNKMFKEKL
jgi:hypothetical protein